MVVANTIERKSKKFIAIRSLRHHPLAALGVTILWVWVIVLLLAPYLTPYTATQQDVPNRLQPPSSTHLLGTDQLGRDIFTRILYGGRISLPIAFAIVLIGAALGTVLGAFAGYWGGWVDHVLMGMTEILQTFPTIILAMVIATALGPSLWNAALALILSWWAPYARLMRGLVLKLKQNEYVESAKALGASHFYILFRTILPNALGVIVVLASLDLSNAIIALAGLSFLGLGAVPPEPEWGRMIAEGVKVFFHGWIVIFPGIAISSVAIAVNFIGDALRDWTDPGALSRYH